MDNRELYSVLFSSAARRDLKRLPSQEVKRILASLKGLQEDPYTHIKRLSRSIGPPLYSFRVREYRAILFIDEEKRNLVVIHLGHRSTIYRAL